jgi:hypothetical protein
MSSFSATSKVKDTVACIHAMAANKWEPATSKYAVFPPGHGVLFFGHSGYYERYGDWNG